MKTVGIIAEYNPFHNGHMYQIEQAKKITGADYCVIVMSGNFVQRGTPAIMDKSLRTKAALMGGADLVIEIPVHYAVASAEYFAGGAVAILDKLGIIDSLCFGSECGDIEILSDISDVLVSESEAFKTVLKQSVKKGDSYPKARNYAISAAAPHLNGHMEILNHPNNILGLEYLKALKKRNSNITPYTIARLGSGYHDTDLNTSYGSAQAIRESITQTHDIQFIKDQIPNCTYELMEQAYSKTFPILPEDISPLLHYKLLMEHDAGFEKYFDIDSGFSDKLRKYIPDMAVHADICDTLKSKNMTYTRVVRNLLHILLNIYQSDVDTYRSEDFVYYARILGFRKSASPLLSAIKSASSIPLISKLADAETYIESPNGINMLKSDIQASHLYSLIVQHKFNQTFQNEYTRQIIIT
ncbi:MAG: nucleotidyltransferase [Lachnospiraceae bacterium]|nr:nucleotidyltransferase [Lachnospiraceae bacterium]